jgi:predicted RNA-binding protein with PIN domain
MLLNMLIIDGTNLLHAIYNVVGDSEAMSDIGMCKAISNLLRLTGEKGEVVFDGKGPPDKSLFDNIDYLEVSFAGMASDTDTVIEDKIRASTAPRGLTIVSSDRRLRKAARARKATSVKSEVFWADLQKQLNRKAMTEEPAAKRQGISASETKQWLDFFGLEQ